MAQISKNIPKVRRCRNGVRHDSAQRDSRSMAGMTAKKKGPLEVLPQGARESSGDLLSRIRGPGTIGDLGLDFRVRDGNGYDPHSMTAETISMAWKPELFAIARMPKPGGSGLPTRTDEPNR